MRQFIFTLTIAFAIITHILFRILISDSFLLKSGDHISSYAEEVYSFQIDSPLDESDLSKVPLDKEIEKEPVRKEWEGVLTMVGD